MDEKEKKRIERLLRRKRRKWLGPYAESSKKGEGES